MTSLELALAHVLAAIEQAKGAGNAHALIALLQRKHAICEALAAPEQSWLEPPAQEPMQRYAPQRTGDAALAAA
jgi:hypothetical protein